jgi:hypothetical protein
MAITEIRILPPLAIARLGDSETPVEAYDLEVPNNKPLGFRQIVPRETLRVDPRTGEIAEAYVPDRIRFKDGNAVRPVAPFLEVFARIDGGELEPLTAGMLEAEGLSPRDVKWTVHVANIKIFRRTRDEADKIEARIDRIADHEAHALEGECANFLPHKRLPLGSVRYIRPTPRFPEIRLRYTPAKGLVYGASTKRKPGPGQAEVPDPVITEDRVLYDPTKGWRGYHEGSTDPKLTNPAQIYAGYDDGDQRVSWGYLDDECDGVVRVEIERRDGTVLEAYSRIGAGPPAYAPDTLPIRTAGDDLEQALLGPSVGDSVPIQEAEEIVRKAFETVRLMNTAIMNGNAIDGRVNVASTMVRQDTNDFGRRYEPITATQIVDYYAILSLHERVFTALRSGAAPWFAEVLRQPEQIGDLSDRGRRRMPALMRGADGRMLALTRRQIDTIERAARGAMFRGDGNEGEAK